MVIADGDVPRDVELCIDIAVRAGLERERVDPTLQADLSDLVCRNVRRVQYHCPAGHR